MKQNRTYTMYVKDILSSIDKIFEYTQGYGFDEFKKDYKTIDAVIRNFEIIGEAAKNLAIEIKEQYSNVPWNEMYSLRNLVSHAYFGIDYEIIWDIIINSLPENKVEIEKILISFHPVENVH